ncbi:98eeb36e-4950-4e9b-ac9f-fd9fafc75414 [Sclerotinia trifoliorum]|uniref:98eeb36e-4950-4e9b-ac9f-fd9fafc75414 n=1 Tax=Sclerotinia trifoliorum TaxID=28548 RepID=A0A8H2ZML2_9HELO|nr:98eeb36e-4950-4e9b-ac9f-fd9fafc75414 [Sclerotinia trifoliorum]
MCPSKYFVLYEMPKSLAGKIDRKALSAMMESFWNEEGSKPTLSIQSGEDISSMDSYWQDEIEKLICHLLSKLVESAANLDSNTNLFALGIDSLKAIRFLQLARDVGITELSIADVFGGATPLKLRNVIVERRKSDTGETPAHHEVGAPPISS